MIKKLGYFIFKILMGLLYIFASSLFDVTIIIGVIVMSYCTGDFIIKMIKEDLNKNEQ